MNEEDPEFKTQIAEQLRNRLARIPGAGSVSLRSNTLVGGKRVDIDCRVEVMDRQYEILVEVKSQGSLSVLRQAAGQLRSIRKSFPDETDLYLAVGAPYISNEGIEVCKEEQVGCLDASGNCYLSFGGIYIEVKGNKNTSREKRSSRSLFSPKSSRVLRVLLSDVKRRWQVQEIAGEAKISIGLVSRLKRKLLEEELAIERDRLIQARSPARLLELWTQNYKYKRNTVREYYSLVEGSQFERRLGQYCTERNIRYALGLFSAAARIAPHVRMNKTFVFVDADLDATANDLDLKPVTSGSNVMLLRPFDAGVFYGTREIDGLQVVSDVQTYIDLKSYKGRGEEAADFLMQHALEPSWQQDPSTDSAR